MEKLEEVHECLNECFIRTHPEFYKIVIQLTEDWEEKNGFPISRTIATKIIADKILKVGGIKA